MYSRVLLSLLLVMALSSCATRSALPPSWNLSSADGERGRPLGRFSNAGECSDSRMKAPTLSALLFNERLEGFDIDSVAIEATEEADRLLIQPYVGAIAVPEHRFFEAEAKKGEQIWTARSDPSFATAYDVGASMIWSGGAIMPISSWVRYRLRLDENGGLIIHMKEKDLVDFFYFFPIPFSKEVWLRYPLHTLPEQTEES